MGKDRQSAFDRAVADTITAQKSAKFMWGGEGVLAVAGGTWLSQIAPVGASTLEIVARSVIGGLGGLAAAIFVIFIWNSFRAPYRQRNELRIKTTELQAKFETKQHKRDVLDSIVALLNQADALFKRRITSDDECEHWCNDINEWFIKAQREISSRVSNSEADIFCMIGSQKDVSYSHAYKGHHGKHNSKLIALKAYQENLKSLYDRLSTSPALGTGGFQP